jgi:ABC-type glucose/galactose transport system permease subunit
MLESIERLMRSFPVLRLLSIATVVMIALCIAIGASIALAGDLATSPVDVAPAIEAIDPDRRMIDTSLAAVEDIYEFDFAVEAETHPHPEFDEPGIALDI